MSGSDFLDAILARKRIEVAESKKERPLASLLERARSTRRRGFADGLAARGGRPRVIAEVKRRSPSAGQLAELDAVATARRYEAAGAAAISVLTDGPGFGGSLADLVEVSSSVAVPALRKDFIVDAHQLAEAAASGASAALLIVAALTPSELTSLLGTARELSLDVLVEVHDAEELDVALASGARVIGINNRNLRTFVVDLATSEALLPKIPADRIAVVESGIRTLDDVRRMRDAGAANFLIGEALVRAADPGALVEQIGALR